MQAASELLSQGGREGALCSMHPLAVPTAIWSDTQHDPISPLCKHKAQAGLYNFISTLPGCNVHGCLLSGQWPLDEGWLWTHSDHCPLRAESYQANPQRFITPFYTSSPLYPGPGTSIKMSRVQQLTMMTISCAHWQFNTEVICLISNDRSKHMIHGSVICNQSRMQCWSPKYWVSHVNTVFINTQRVLYTPI